MTPAPEPTAEPAPSPAPTGRLRTFFAQLERRRRLLFSIALAAVLIPAIYIGSLVLEFGVNVPLWDDWDMVPMIVDAHEGDLKFGDLFAQQLEARTLLPKLLFILFTFFGRFDARDGMMFSVVVCALTAAAFSCSCAGPDCRCSRRQRASS
jgi:hypothetical protein